MTRYPPHELRLRTDTETSRPKTVRTQAELDVLIKKHETRKAVFIKEMTRTNMLTAMEAAQQYDDKFRRW